MFVKAIAFRDVRPGDMVSENVDCGWYEIGRCETPSTGMVRLHIAGGGVLEGPSEQLIGLFHRPYSECRPKSQVRENIALFARTLESVAQFGEDVFTSHSKRLREVIEEWELGKSMPGARVGARMAEDEAEDFIARLKLTERLENIVGRARAVGKPMNPDEVREAREALDAYCGLSKPKLAIKTDLTAGGC